LSAAALLAEKYQVKSKESTTEQKDKRTSMKGLTDSDCVKEDKLTQEIKPTNRKEGSSKTMESAS
jgi:hypothetical protein